MKTHSETRKIVDNVFAELIANGDKHFTVNAAIGCYLVDKHKITKIPHESLVVKDKEITYVIDSVTYVIEPRLRWVDISITTESKVVDLSKLGIEPSDLI